MIAWWIVIYIYSFFSHFCETLWTFACLQFNLDEQINAASAQIAQGVMTAEDIYKLAVSELL
jgi:hypothetical protein